MYKTSTPVWLNKVAARFDLAPVYWEFRPAIAIAIAFYELSC